MSRDIPVGNGRLLVTFDHQYQLRDFYYPHVGQENHAGGNPFRLGVFQDAHHPAANPSRFGFFSDVAGTGHHQLFWPSSPGWTIRQRYLRDTLTTSVSLE